jgi:hypothetical protein
MNSLVLKLLAQRVALALLSLLAVSVVVFAITAVLPGTPVAVGGRRAPLSGRVSMDMLTVDLTDLPSARVGTEVELWGRDVAVGEVAARAGTIAYELLCNAKRAPKRYVGVAPSRTTIRPASRSALPT